MSIINILKRQRWFWLAGVICIVAIRVWSQNSYDVENFYTSKFYYFFAILLRFLFGWIPFSIGDIFYFLTGLWIFWKIVKNVRMMFKKQFTRDLFIKKLGRSILILMSIYIVFNIFWGLNYNRKGIAWQLQLPKNDYDTSSLLLMQQLLLQKVNEAKQSLVDKKITYPEKKEIFIRAKKCYDSAAKVLPFIQYKSLSVKSSLYGWMGNYLGFTGYYNPFTGEAQVNTTVPKFLIPYVALHEMGHQLGYAKEDEANFSGYLAAANSHDTLFQYSTYLDLFVYANREVYFFDSSAAKNAALQLIPEIKADLLEWRNFNRKYTSVFEPAISWLYGKYLQANLQPKGLRSYNEVIATLISYYKKFGKI